MKVSDLIEGLKKLDKDKEIYLTDPQKEGLSVEIEGVVSHPGHYVLEEEGMVVHHKFDKKDKSNDIFKAS